MTNSSRARIDFPSRIGVWWASDTWPITAAQEVARDIEQLGYGSLFIPEVTGKECLTQSAALLAATQRLVVGTGIANIHVRIATAAESGARTLSALYPGRFVLGLGVSHAPLVEHGMGGTYAKPLATMRGYLERMTALPEAIEPGAGRPVRLLAALGPKMIELSGELADGAHP
jgi:probable F420-dependent oxidoreductase